ncbi:DUF6527 family protein [Delftia tsuruhatensis]|uniref:DUF6527 family protein n=1 Tax=Delftia tsuruhatensis TaxID=180282 RepID=UPI003BAEAE88
MWRDLLRRLLSRLGLIEPPALVVKFSAQHPNPAELKDGVVVVVLGDSHPKWACFRCPGGCGGRFQLPLNPDRRPQWIVTTDWLHRATISPSVLQTNGCQAHFWVRQGKVEWCQDSAPH